MTAREKWGGIIVSPNRVWKVLCRHRLNKRAKPGTDRRLRRALPTARDRGPEQHIDVDRPGERHRLLLRGRLRGTDGAIWQLTAIDIASSFAWAELVICKQGNPTALQASRLAKRVAADLKAAGWCLDRVLSDYANELRGPAFREILERLSVRHIRIHAGRPQPNGHVEALHKTILDECWRPASARYIYPRYTGCR